MLSGRLVRPLLPAVMIAGLLLAGCGGEDGGPTAPAAVGSGTITLQTDPQDLQAPWLLAGPGGLRETGVGASVLADRPAGSYTLIWRDCPDHVLPEPSVVAFDLDADGAHACTGSYRFAPRARVEVAFEPAALPVHWTLTGPDGTTIECRGEGAACELFDGEYTLTCQAPPGWEPVTALEHAQTVAPEETWRVAMAFQPQQQHLGLALADDGQVWRSDDDGLAWRPVGHLGFGNARAIALPEIDVAYAVAGARILRSLDGGATWEVCYVHPDAHVTFQEIAFGDWSTGLAVGAAGTIVGTRNGGETWHDRTLTSGGHFLGATVIGAGDDALAVAVGSKLAQERGYFQAAASEHAFVPRFAVPEVEPLFFDVPPAEVIPPDGLPYLHDFGRDAFTAADWRWNERTRDYSLFFVGTDGAYVTTRYDPDEDPFPGQFDRFTRTVGIRYNAVCDGLAVGQSGWIRPADRWARPTTIGSEDLFDVAAVGDGVTFVVVGAQGVVLRGDGQDAWSRQSLPGAALRSVAFVSALPAAE